MSNDQPPAPDYEVGYARPPKEHRFKKGAPSANPRGRPKKLRALDAFPADTVGDCVLAELSQLIQLTEQGKEVALPAHQAIVRRLLVLALKGNLKAIQYLFELMDQASAAKKKKDAFHAANIITTDDPHEAARIYQDMVAGRLTAF
jgi:hypothetical protein